MYSMFGLVWVHSFVSSQRIKVLILIQNDDFSFIANKLFIISKSVGKDSTEFKSIYRRHGLVYLPSFDTHLSGSEM